MQIETEFHEDTFVFTPALAIQRSLNTNDCCTGYRLMAAWLFFTIEITWTV